MTAEVEFRHNGVHCGDLRGAGSAELFVHVEGDIQICCGDRVLFAEQSFPVFELGHAIAAWLDSPPGDRGDFVFDSMSFEEQGVVFIRGDGDGWRVGSVFESEPSDRLAWSAVERAARNFIARLNADVAALGLAVGG